jgi:hypothetical protein
MQANALMRGLTNSMLENGNASDRRGFIFIVGAPKCATTTVHGWLSAHPDVHEHQVTKEPRYFTDFADKAWTGPGIDGFKATLISSPEAYFGGFGAGRDGDGGWALDSSTDYLSCEASSGMIARFAETAEARVIALVRDPIERAFSEYQHTRRDHMQTESFARSLELEPERIAAGMAPLFQHVRRSRYHEALGRYRAAFGDRFLLLDGHRMKEIAALRDQLAAFLDLPDLSLDDGLRKNASHVDRFAAISRLLRNPVVRKAARSLLPRSVRSRAYDKVSAMNRTRLTLTENEADFAYGLMARDIETCLADPLIPTENWATVAAARARTGAA